MGQRYAWLGDEKLYSTILSEDILAEGKLDVSEIFDSIYLVNHNITDGIIESESALFNMTKLTKMMMMIDTRPTYPSSKLTFTIANVTKNKDTRFFNIYLNGNETFDVDVVLEESKRTFLNSLFIYIFCVLFQ